MGTWVLLVGLLVAVQAESERISEAGREWMMSLRSEFEERAAKQQAVLTERGHREQEMAKLAHRLPATYTCSKLLPLQIQLPFFSILT